MEKELSEMTLEELWQLFPIILTKHNREWKTWYDDEAELLIRELADIKCVKINHIGSTAIKGICAKPTVDILLEVQGDSDFGEVKRILSGCGYSCMSESEKRISFNKGYTKSGFAERVFHLHLRIMGDNDELYFRDYMNEHPEEAKEYEKLKLSLCQRYEHDRDGYTEAKTEFIDKYTQIARRDKS